MKNKIFLAVTAAFLLNSTMAQAEVKTFYFTFDGAANQDPYKNSQKTTGFVTLNTDLIGTVLIASDRTNRIPIDQIVDLSMTVTGAGSGNGVFTESDFSHIAFNSTSPLDYSRELVGQTLTSGRRFGDFEGLTGRFAFSPITPSAPFSSYWYELATNAKAMTLTSLTAIAPVPEADTSAMLLMGAGVMGFMARRRKQLAA